MQANLFIPESWMEVATWVIQLVTMEITKGKSCRVGCTIQRVKQHHEDHKHESFFLTPSLLLDITSSSSACLGLQAISKSKLGVKKNDSCLWSSWCCFTRWIVHPTRHGLPFVISIARSWTSSTQVATSVHDSGINKLPYISQHKQFTLLFSFLFPTKFSTTQLIFHDTISFPRHN